MEITGKNSLREGKDTRNSGHADISGFKDSFGPLYREILEPKSNKSKQLLNSLKKIKAQYSFIGSERASF